MRRLILEHDALLALFNPDRGDHHWGKRKLKRDE